MSLVIVASIAAAQTSISFKLNHTTEVPHASNIYSITTETYYSDPISLGPGHMIFTSPSSTPLTLPSGRIGITSFFGDIVDADHQPVPLSKVASEAARRTLPTTSASLPTLLPLSL